MSALVQRDFDFQAGVYFQNTFLLNYYNFTLFLEVNTESVHEQNIAMERIKFFIYEIVENAIIVQDTETDVIKKYQDAGLKVCAIPEEPYDQILALLLMLKINAICEDRLKVVDILFTSKLSDEVKFKESIQTAEHTFDDIGWYNDPSPYIANNKKSGREKIVKIKNGGWNEIGLVWKEKKDKPKEIVFSIEPEK